MLLRETQQKFFNDRVTSIINHIQLFQESRDLEEIHHLRVEIKKIKSLTFFVKNCSPNSKFREVLRPLKKIFKSAGLIRTTAINLQTIPKFEMLSLTYDHVKLQRKYIEEFLGKTEKSVKILKKLNRTYKNELNDIPSECILIAYRNSIEFINSLLQIPEDYNLHESRKRIKIMFHTWNILPHAIKDELKLNIDYLRELEQFIGNWHDCIHIFEFFDKYNYSTEKIQLIKGKRQKLLELVLSSAADFKDKVILKVPTI